MRSTTAVNGPEPNRFAARAGLSAAPKHDQAHRNRRTTDADLANAATDSNLTGLTMGQLRTANKRHNRAIATLEANKKSAKIAPVAATTTKAAS